jgi:hypothetical protein
MKIALWVGAVAAPILLSAAAPLASAGSEGCRDAVDHYNSVLGDVSDTLRRYGKCVAGSQGHDDCSTEFRRLKNSQDEFESAVSEIESECD